MSQADELFALLTAREMLRDVSRDLRHESDYADPGICGASSEHYGTQYICAACTMEHALQHNQRERARVLGVSLSTVMVMDLGAMLPRRAERSAA